MRNFIFILLVSLLSATLVFADAATDRQQTVFIQNWVAAIKNKNPEQIKILIHPECLSAITSVNEDYLNYYINQLIFNGELKDYKFKLSKTSMPSNQDDYFDGLVTMPVIPAYNIELKIVSDNNVRLFGSISSLNGQWYFVIPVPTEKGMEQFRLTVNKQ